MVRGTGAASYTYLATVYTTLGIRAHPTRPTRPEGPPPGLVPGFTKTGPKGLLVGGTGDAENIDPPDEITFGEKKHRERKRILEEEELRTNRSKRVKRTADVSF
jgi:hypothetical protein